MVRRPEVVHDPRHFVPQRRVVVLWEVCALVPPEEEPGGPDTRPVTTIPDWLAGIGLVVPAGTGLVGYVLAGRNEQARDERAAKPEAVARRASVRERLGEQSHAFQRETLLELQDALQRQVRSVAKVILHDRRTLQEQGTLTLLGPELDEENYEIGVTVRRLQQRVLGAGLREAVDAFRRHVTQIETSFAGVSDMNTEHGIRQLERLQLELGEHYIALSDQVGTALRAELGWLPEETSPV